MPKTCPAQPGLFDSFGPSPAEPPQARDGSSIRPTDTNSGVAEPNANPQMEDPTPEAAPPVPTQSPAAMDAGSAQTVVNLVESEAPRQTPPIEELTRSKVQSEIDGHAGISTFGASPDHSDAPAAVVSGYALHAGDQTGRVPVTEATGCGTDASREPEEADQPAHEAQNGDDRDESGGGDESGQTGALDEDGATEASLSGTAPMVSPEPAAVTAAPNSPEASGTNQPADPHQPAEAPSNGTTISSSAGPKKGSPPKKMVPRRLIRVHPDVEMILREAGLFDLWDDIWRNQTGPTNTKTALLKGAGVKALRAVTELRAIREQDEYLCYSNTWIFRHLECILTQNEEIAVEVHAKVSRDQLRQEVLNEYLLRPVYYRLPAERSIGRRLLASMRKLAASGLFEKMTVRKFRHWTGFSTGSMSNQGK